MRNTAMQRERRLRQIRVADDKGLNKLDTCTTQADLDDLKAKKVHLARKRQTTSNVYWLNSHLDL